MKMLEFNYDFLDIYVDRADYMLLEMDTDSNYLCLSAENMHEVIKPNMRERYEHHLRGYCCDDAVSNPLGTYDAVLRNQKAGHGMNRGIRARHNTMFTYTQERSGFSYFYCKRKVLEDGISTEPLNIVLKPNA